jgi:hypothetical protein
MVSAGGVPLNNGTEAYPNGDEVQVAERWHPPDAWAGASHASLNAVLDVIEAGLPNGDKYSHDPRSGNRCAWKAVIELLPEKSEGQAKEIVATWIKSGTLQVVDCTNQATRHTVKGLQVNPLKRPS